MRTPSVVELRSVRLLYDNRALARPRRRQAPRPSNADRARHSCPIPRRTGWLRRSPTSSGSPGARRCCGVDLPAQEPRDDGRASICQLRQSTWLDTSLRRRRRLRRRCRRIRGGRRGAAGRDGVAETRSRASMTRSLNVVSARSWRFVKRSAHSGHPVPRRTRCTAGASTTRPRAQSSGARASAARSWTRTGRGTPVGGFPPRQPPSYELTFARRRGFVDARTPGRPPTHTPRTSRRCARPSHRRLARRARRPVPDLELHPLAARVALGRQR